MWNEGDFALQNPNNNRACEASFSLIGSPYTGEPNPLSFGSL